MCLFGRVLCCCFAVRCVIPNGVLVFNTIFGSRGYDGALACDMPLSLIASNYSSLDYAVGTASHAPPMCRTTWLVTNHGNVILSCNPAFNGLAASASFAMGQPFSLYRVISWRTLKLCVTCWTLSWEGLAFPRADPSLHLAGCRFTAR